MLNEGRPGPPPDPDSAAPERSVTERTLRSARIVLLARVGGLLATFVGSVALARSLGPDDRGAQAFFVSVVLVLVAVLGMSNPVGSYVLATREGADRRRLGGNAVSASIVAGVVATSVVAILDTWLQVLPPNLAAVPGLLAAVFLATFGIAYSGYQLQLALAEGRALVGAFLSFGVFATAGICYLGLAVTGGGLPAAIWIATAAPYLTLGIAALARPRLGALSAGRPSWRLMGRTLRHGLRFYPGEIAALLHLRVDVILLGLLAPLAFAGVYVVAYQAAEPILVIASAAQASLLALGSDEQANAGSSPAARLTRETIVLATGLAIAAAIVAPFLIPMMYGSDFGPAVGPFLVLLPAVVALATARIAIAELTRANRLELTVVASGVALVVNVVLNIALIPSFGAMGAAAASAGSYGLLAVVTLLFVTRATAVPTREFIPSRSDVRAVARGWRSLPGGLRRGARPGRPSTLA